LSIVKVILIILLNWKWYLVLTRPPLFLFFFYQQTEKVGRKKKDRAYLVYFLGVRQNSSSPFWRVLRELRYSANCPQMF
jgi:hypothetical protein